MRKPDDRGRLQDILNAIKRIQSYLRGSDERKFTNDLMRQDAITRQIEILGEAARNVSAEFQEQHRQIPWSLMIGMRNKIAHDYSDIDIPEIWRTARNDIPQLKKAISKLLKEL
jgi:uncharacterized protein with HEPN domain